MNDIEQTQNDLNDIVSEMKSISDQDKIKLYIEEREQLEPKVRRLHEAKGTIQSNVSRYKKELEEIEFRLRSEVKAQSKANHNAALHSIISELMDVTTEAEKQIVAAIREEISDKTFENFINLIWKENTYQNIVIDQNYNVDLIHKKAFQQ